MDTWWNARMSPTARDNAQRTALRVAPWQQTVGRTGESTHNVLFGDMRTVLQKIADENPEETARLVLAGIEFPTLTRAVADPYRSDEEIAAALRDALGDRAASVGRLLAA
jgi:hypothetical protein